MRLIFAKILIAFDLELVEKEKDWMSEQPFFIIWEKEALKIKVKPVKQS
jgi:hypothetical protein